METQVKRTRSLTLVLLLILLVVSSYGATVVVAWARGFPNRLQESMDSLANAMAPAYVESVHDALRHGDVATKTQLINEHLIPAIDGHPDAAAWVRNEYYDDLVRLAASDDLAVSSAASDVLSKLKSASSEKPINDGG
ncbi:hypothetical protein [Allorhodopirellula heiligendammensis]|uniref:Uncharacterized protein n=1 Tax=Allorhodopirellula heiligendammensis TaxID=2714739 RepID=A0A5C6BDR3_9BACT|nr:hypothetical protein [Allorhodopirellula heiligendammensis]TWU09777.1 hypothetical protein Poly21_55220 [Allorhodopirellula heiligendammensis]